MEKSTLKKGEKLTRGQRLSSPDLRYRLSLQDDGNFVLYKHPDFRQALWSSRIPVFIEQKEGKSILDVHSVGINEDGQLVGYTQDNKIAWQSTQFVGGTYLQVQNDGNVILFDDAGKGVWSTNEGGATESGATGSNNENPLKLDAAWYGNCAGNGVVILKSSEALAKFPEVKAMLLVRNLNFGTKGLYASPYASVPALKHFQDLANQKADSWACTKGKNKCQNERNEMREQYFAEALKQFDDACQEAARNEALMIEAIATKTTTVVKEKIVEDNYSPEAREEAAVILKDKTKQTTYIVIGVVVLMGIVIWQIMKK